MIRSAPLFFWSSRRSASIPLTFHAVFVSFSPALCLYGINYMINYIDNIFSVVVWIAILQEGGHKA